MMNLRTLARLLALVLVALPATAAAQPAISETGWSQLYTQATAANTGVVAIGPTGTVYWATTDSATTIKSRSPQGAVTSLHNTAEVTGVAASGSAVFFTSNTTNQLKTFVPGQVPTVVVTDFRPSSSNDDFPAGLEQVPATWAGGTIVAAGEWVLADAGGNDVVYAVNASGTARVIGNDISAYQTLVDVAVTGNSIIVADRAGQKLYALSGNSAANGVAQTISPDLGGSPVAVEYDKSTGTLLVAVNRTGANDRLLRLSSSGANSWTSTIIGTGFDFASAATQVLDLSPDGTTLVVASQTSLVAFARCTLAGANDCDKDGRADVCNVLVDLATDCNGNLAPDACDLAPGGGSTDCDGDHVPDECAACSAPVEIVFAVDTSPSMDDEASTLCGNINGIVTSLADEGIEVQAHIYGIGQDYPDAGTAFSCLTATIPEAVGTSDVPAVDGVEPVNTTIGTTTYNQQTLASGCSGSGIEEDWGRGTSVLSGYYPWTTGTIKVVVPVSDEGAWCGTNPDAVNAVDEYATTWAAKVANAHGVIVSPILASGFSDAANVPVESHAVNLANATGGIVSRELAGAALVDAVKNIVRNACIASNDCDHNGVNDLCDVQNGAQDCNGNGRPDVCDGTVHCNVAPTAVDDRGFTQAGQAISLTVTDNDADPEGGLAVGTVDLDPSVAGPQKTVNTAAGTFAVSAAGVLTYTPSVGFAGLAEIAYTVADVDGAVSDPARVVITVNAAPVAVADSAIGLRGTAIAMAPAVTANDTDSDGTIKVDTVDLDPATAGRQTSKVVASGTFTVDSAGVVTFTPTSSTFVGTATASYVVQDDRAGVSNAATLTVRVVECLGAGDCGDGNECTSDGCALNACTHAPVAPGQPCAGGVCNGASACVACVDDKIGADIDTGCNATNRECDTTAAPVCVPCEDDVSGGAQDSGCTSQIPLCNEALNPDQCVSCLDDRGAGQIDTGCSAVLNACDTTTATNPGCVDCQVDADCQSGNVCQQASHTCAPCIDTAAGAGLDKGCSAVIPICDTRGEPDECVSCVDDQQPGTTDTGCSTALPACKDPTVGPSTCVECVVDADCKGGEVCDEAKNTCEPCLDTLPGAGQDDGCVAVKPICDVALTPDLCVECVNDKPARERDTGCTAAQPTCDTTSPTNPDCVECVTSADCAQGEVCDPVQKTCHGCLDDKAAGQVDTGCSATTNACDTAQADGVCVDCQSDPDCTTGALPVCDVSRETCVPCLDTAAGTGQDHGCAAATPLCDTRPVVDECTRCVDDKAAGQVDTGCSVATPACDDTPGSGTANTCWQCLSDADCGAGTICDEPRHACVPCLDTATGALQDDGCNAALPLCNLALDPDQCVRCVDDRPLGAVDTGCNVGAPACILGDLGQWTCVECQADGDCAPGTICNELDHSCEGCLDDKGPGLVDDGCNEVKNACDDTAPGGPNRCVDCEVDDDCFGSDVCDVPTRTCLPCMDTAPGHEVDAGCSSGAPICDEGALGGPTCVPCEDTAVGPAVDEGCTTALPACDPRVPGAITCVECRDDLSCLGVGGGGGVGGGSDEVCDLQTSRCEPCIDSAAGTTVDHGCFATKPMCDTTRDPNACVECVDTQPAGEIDLGCALAAPACDPSAPGGPDCVGCLVDGDCRGGQLCDPQRHTCVGCVDDHAAGQVDSGCEVKRNACDDTTATSKCVDCEVDADCGAGDVCRAADKTCVPCLDTKDGAAVDAGCDAALPICLGSGTPAASCNQCIDDRPPGTTDTGCSGAAPSCLTGTAQGHTCVACLDDADCGAGTVCDASHQCVSCLDTAPGAGVDHGCGDLAPLCDVALEPDRCVLCVDDQPGSAVDSGCAALAPFCHGAGGAARACVECEQDDDCPVGDTCHAASGVCVPPLTSLAVKDRYATQEGTTLTVDAAHGVMANDVLPAGTIGSVAVLVPTDPTTRGTLTLAADGALVFAPAPGFSGVATFRYVLTPSEGTTSEADVEIRVNGIPRPVDDQAEASGEPVVIAVLGNDRDPDGDALDVTRVTVAPSLGTARVNGDGTVTYTPTAGQAGVDHFTYEVCDELGACATAVVTVDVVITNHPPSVRDERVTTPEDTAVLVVPLGNDADPDGDPIRLERVVDGPLHGAVVVGADGTLRYTPERDYVGPDVLTYEVCDTLGACATGTLALAITPVNDPPVAGPDGATTPKATVVVIAVLDNDADVDSTLLTVTRVTDAPDHGVVSVGAGGLATYTPSATYTGTDTFRYEVCDDRGACAEADVTVFVGVENRAPVAADDDATTAEGAAVAVAVSDNDDDPDGDALTVSFVGTPSHGNAVADADGMVTYTPSADFVGVDTFPYTVCDDAGACASAVVTVTVTRLGNSPPVATDDVASTRRNLAVTIAVTANDFDPDGDPVTVDLVAVPPAHGAVRVNADGTVTYTPDTGFVGDDRFVVQVKDGRGGTDTADVFVVVRADDNLPPQALDDAFDVQAATPTPLDVRKNDTDPNDDELYIVDIVQPAWGRVVLTPTGDLEYRPDGLPTARDADGRPFVTFAYVVSDGRGGTDGATVTLRFPTPNAPPEAQDDIATTPEDTGVLVVVQSNDRDADGDPLDTTRVVLAPRHGTATLDGDAVLYVPTTNWWGVDAFTYDVCDPDGACAQALVVVTTTPVNDRPIAADDAVAIAAGEARVIDVILNDSDPDGDPLTVARVVAAPVHGLAFANPDGTITYQPSEGFAGIDKLTYEVCDPSGLCATAIVTVDVGSGNREPVAEDDDAETLEGEPVVMPVLDNDSDPDGDALSVQLVEDPPHGTATASPDGRIEYTPDADFVGTEAFFYVVCDERGACATAFVVVTVGAGDNDPPLAVDDTIATPAGVAVTFDPRANDSDPDGDALTTVSATDPAHGTTSVGADGRVTYTPDPGYTGEDTFEVAIDDGHGGRATSTVRVVVTPWPNQVPDARDDSYAVETGFSATLRVLDNDGDPDNDPIAVVDVVQPAHGSVTLAPTGLTYLSDPSYCGPDTFTYTIGDGRGAFDTAAVTVRVSDRDGDRLCDQHEVDVTNTDPDDPDTDHDGVMDGDEVAGGDDATVYEPGVDTDPLDADTDDDGLRDGVEVSGTGPLAGFEPTDPLDADSDDDGVDDGVEVGVTSAIPGGVTPENGVPYAGTDLTVWIPDADPATKTDPNDDDSDDDGLLDGAEDSNGNGSWDGVVGGTGSVGTGETDPNDPDTDGDDIQDGTEVGLTAPEGEDTDPQRFVPDADPTTTTDPLDTDSDDGGVRDGVEDVNHNGMIDGFEIDPNRGVDDLGGRGAGYVAEGGGCAGGPVDLSLVGLAVVGLALVAARRRHRHPTTP